MRRVTCGLTLSIAVLLAVSLCGLPTAYGQKPKPDPQRGLQVDTAPSAAASPPVGYYALVIGNNNYRYVQGLKTPANDAQSVAQLLQNRYGFKTQLLIDATHNQILTALVLYRKSLNQNSNLLIYYAGHGYLDLESEESYWLPVDADKDNNENWISADDITRDLKAMPSRHVLVISDSCYSGAILEGRDLRDPGAGINPQEHIAYLAKKQGAKSRNWMSSGSVEPVADNGAPGHSIFAAAIIQGLSQAKDDQFAASDLFYSFVQRKVGGVATQLPQYGSIRNSGDALGDFIFSRAGAPLPDDPGPAPVIEFHEQLPDPPSNNRTNFDPEAERNAISAVLHQYEEAYNLRDANSLWTVWPTAATTTKQLISTAFQNAKSIKMSLQQGTPNIASDGRSASVRGQFSEQYMPRNGRLQQHEDEGISFTLKKNSGVWTIVDVK